MCGCCSRKEEEGNDSSVRVTVAGEGGGYGVSVRSAQWWLRLRAREAAAEAALAGGRSKGERRGLCAGGAAIEEEGSAFVDISGRRFGCTRAIFLSLYRAGLTQPFLNRSMSFFTALRFVCYFGRSGTTHDLRWLSVGWYQNTLYHFLPSPTEPAFELPPCWDSVGVLLPIVPLNYIFPSARLGSA
ncbi:hypothetical protein BHE74_00050881 [Ensete ventricosum]|nr:hypothetical protein BHE74_00050881 [Ensete ventricosum]